MIHVRVREQHEVHAGQLSRRERGSHEALGADGADEHVRARMIHQQRISQDVNAVKIDEHRGVAEPGGGDAVGIPEFGRGGEIGRENLSA